LFRRFHWPTAHPLSETSRLGLARRVSKLSLGSGLWASRFTPLNPLTVGALLPGSPLTNLRLASTSFPAGALRAPQNPFWKGSQVTVRSCKFPLAYCSSPCGDKTPWAGLPGGQAFARIQLVGFPACAFRPTDGRCPVARVAADQLTVGFSQFPH
jgi:hypothetical protein